MLPLGEDRFALLLGDLAGRGSRVVAAMRRLRATARAYALQEVRSGLLLARLDEFMARAGEDEYPTLWYAEHRPSTGTLTYAAAGHPPPV